MYDNKRDFYTNIGVDREGQAEAYRALTGSCRKIIKASLNEDTFRILLLDESEKDPCLGYRTLLSEWLIAFAMSGQVHNDDRAVYMKYTNINYLREYFQKGNKVISTQYRRKINNEYKQVILEVIPAPDYRPDDESVFLYVKCVE